ncbi:TetR/AcrR family transcriptional regulator [Lacticaseibacillus sp. GG6-2]
MNKNDLRYRKTEANLNQAYLSLLATQDCNSITVSQLCSLAQCARNTFYQHYPDLQTLKDHIIGQVLDDMANAFRNTGVTLNQIDAREIERYVDNIVTGIDNQRQTLQILVAKDDGTFQKQLENVIYTQVLAGDRTLSNVADTAINRLNAAYLAAAVAGFIARWLAEPTVTTEVAKQTLLTMHQHTIATSTAYLATDPH